MPKIILTKGLPGSGKSTWAREEIEQSKGQIVAITKDDLRKMFAPTKKREKLVLQTRDTLTEMYLQQGLDVIWHDTNFNPIHFRKAMDICTEISKYREPEDKDIFYVETKDFTDVPLEECIKRDLQRPNSVGEKEIKKMWRQYIKPTLTKTTIQQDPKLPHVVLCDVDGTIALMDERGPYEWDKVGEDKPNQPIIELIDSLDLVEIIFISGRDEVCRQSTLDWIDANHTMYRDPILLMRPQGDTCKDSVVKRELFDQHIRDKYYVEFVLDDRDQVVQMWRSLGLTCLQVADGDF
jgi:predicted kinase